jgi:hypothetical protein
VEVETSPEGERRGNEVNVGANCFKMEGRYYMTLLHTLQPKKRATLFFFRIFDWSSPDHPKGCRNQGFYSG